MKYFVLAILHPFTFNTEDNKIKKKKQVMKIAFWS